MEIIGLGNIDAGVFNGNQYFQADIKTTLTFLENVGVVHEDLILNDMGFFNISKNIVDGKAKFVSPTALNYITQGGSNGCAWNPVGGMTYNMTDAALDKHLIQMEQCPEIVPCWESLFGIGNQVESWTATPVGRKLLDDLIKGVYRGIGNDMYKGALIGNHPILTAAEASYTGDPDFYAQLKSTLSITGGWFTMIDELASSEGGQYAVPINSSEFSGSKFTGNPITLFQRMKDAMPSVFKQAAKQQKAYGRRPCILVSGSIFSAYKEWLMTNHPTIPDLLLYRMSNEFSSNYGLNAQAPATGILGWDDFWIKEMDGLDVVAEEIQVTHHRATMVMPGILGLGLDVAEVSGYKGMGLRMEESTQLKERGKIYMSTNYKMGTALTDKKFIVNASVWVK